MIVIPILNRTNGFITTIKNKILKVGGEEYKLELYAARLEKLQKHLAIHKKDKSVIRKAKQLKSWVNKFSIRLNKQKIW